MLLDPKKNSLSRIKNSFFVQRSIKGRNRVTITYKTKYLTVQKGEKIKQP